MESKTLKKLLNITKQTQIYRKQTAGYQTGEKREEGQVLLLELKGTNLCIK